MNANKIGERKVKICASSKIRVSGDSIALEYV